MNLTLVLTPPGSLPPRREAEPATPEPAHGGRLEAAFARGTGHGLLSLGADEVGAALPPVLSYWRELATRYVTALCALPNIGEGQAKPPVPAPADEGLSTMAAAAPPMTGAEYLTASVLADLWRGMDGAFEARLVEAELPLQRLLKSLH